MIATNGSNTALVATGINPSDVIGNIGIVTTSNATPTTIASLNYATASGTAYAVRATFLARQTNAPNPAASFTVRATFNNIAGVLTLIDNANDLVYVPSTITWTAAIAVSGTNIVFIVTGAIATTINWTARVDPILTI